MFGETSNVRKTILEVETTGNQPEKVFQVRETWEITSFVESVLMATVLVCFSESFVKTDKLN